MTPAHRLRSFMGLCKATLSLFAALSAAAGFLLAGGPAEAALMTLSGGVFLLACGACALNQVQERKTDCLMPRTAGRPIPAGEISPDAALAFSLALIGAGTAVLSSAGFYPPLLGLVAILGYNGLYTPLKARHPFAAIPGALIGAIPPAIGWMAAGAAFDARLGALCFFFFMWQVPHFLVLQQAFGKQYEAIHLASLTGVFSKGQIDRLTRQWLLAAAVSLQLVVFYGLIASPFVHLGLTASSLGFAAGGTLFLTRRRPDYAGIFLATNGFMVVVLVLIFLDRLPLVPFR
jgi:protoheme IX farnesyltransferase